MLFSVMVAFSERRVGTGMGKHFPSSVTDIGKAWGVEKIIVHKYCFPSCGRFPVTPARELHSGPG